MTKDEILQERRWLMARENRKNQESPEYKERLEKFNQEVDAFNSELVKKAKAAVKSLKIGDIVYLPEKYNRKGLWRVSKLMQKNVILSPVGESDIKGRIKCSAEILVKVEEEDESLVNSLDDIGLI